MQQELHIKDSTRGRFAVRFSIPLDIYDGFLAPGEQPGLAAFARFFDRDKTLEYFTAADGFGKLSYRRFEQGERVFVRIKGDISDLPKALASGKLGDIRLRPLGDGVSEIRIVCESNRIGSGPVDGETRSLLKFPGEAAEKELLRSLFAGMQLVLTIAVPNEIIASAGSRANGQTVQWTFDPGEDDAFLYKLPEIRVTYR